MVFPPLVNYSGCKYVKNCSQQGVERLGECLTSEATQRIKRDRLCLEMVPIFIVYEHDNHRLFFPMHMCRKKLNWPIKMEKCTRIKILAQSQKHKVKY